MASPQHTVFLLFLLAIAAPAFAQTDPLPAPLPPTLQKIRTANAIVLAHRENSLPFSYYDQNKRPIGYSMDLCLRVVEAVRRELKQPNLRVDFLPVAPAERISSLLSGKADLECGNTTNTAARRKQVAFSVTHYFAGGRLLVRADSTVQRLSDLRNKAVAATRGSTHAAFLNSQVDRGINDFRVIEAKDSDEAFALLADRKVDAFLHDDIVLYGLRANASQPEAYMVVGDYTTVEPLAIMLRKGDPEFKRLVDTTLSRMMIDGEVALIYNRWFRSPVPPKNINLAVPLSPLMRDQLRFPTDKVGDELGG